MYVHSTTAPLGEISLFETALYTYNVLIFVESFFLIFGFLQKLFCVLENENFTFCLKKNQHLETKGSQCIGLLKI